MSSMKNNWFAFVSKYFLTEVSRFYRGYDLGSITSGKMLL